VTLINTAINYYSRCAITEPFPVISPFVVITGIDKKSLFGLHRPAQAEIMPEPVLSSEFMA
jgi:hypothetical protein